MITITFEHKDNYIVKFEAKGHANSAEHGKDLVCAAVSAIITGAFNAIPEDDKIELMLKEGHAVAKVQEFSKENENVLHILYVQLYTVANAYKEYIKIKNF